MSGAWVYIDGKFYDKSEAKVSVFDHGLLYGDGVFEGIRAYQGCIFRLRQHLERLYASAKYIMMEIPISIDEMAEVVKESCRKNELRDAYIRLVVTRGVGDLGLSPWKCPKPSVICIAAKIQLYPEELYKTGLQVITASTQRSGAQVNHPRVKSLNYLNNILAKIEAVTTGHQEALLVNAEGYVVEATGDNIFVVKNGVLTTPPTWMGALCGVTRDAVVELAKDSGIEVREEPITRYEIYTASEMFLTGTAAEVIPVTKVDARVIGDGKPGPKTLDLVTKFRSIVSRDGMMI